MVLLILNRILEIICLFAFGVYAYDIKCEQGTITSVIEYSLKTRKIEMCFLHEDERSYFVSKKCSKKCDALYRKKIFIKFNDLLHQFGKPGFKLCRFIGGQPELVTLKTSKYSERINTDRCVFQDKSFVSTDYLMQLYLDH